MRLEQNILPAAMMELLDSSDQESKINFACEIDVGL